MGPLHRGRLSSSGAPPQEVVRGMRSWRQVHPGVHHRPGQHDARRGWPVQSADQRRRLRRLPHRAGDALRGNPHGQQQRAWDSQPGDLARCRCREAWLEAGGAVHFGLSLPPGTPHHLGEDPPEDEGRAPHHPRAELRARLHYSQPGAGGGLLSVGSGQPEHAESPPELPGAGFLRILRGCRLLPGTSRPRRPHGHRRALCSPMGYGDVGCDCTLATSSQNGHPQGVRSLFL